MGEFGAVSVVSGHIRGSTNTLPLHIEILYNEYQFAAAFACASLLAILALVTLALKSWIESRTQDFSHASRLMPRTYTVQGAGFAASMPYFLMASATFAAGTSPSSASAFSAAITT